MSTTNSADSPPLSYAASGVDIDTEAASVKALITALGQRASAREAGTRGALVPHAGGFSGLIEFGDQLLGLCTDGVGSKLLLAAELRYYESVALDCVAMNVNDLLCVGAEPLAFVDYMAAPAPDARTWAALGRSLAEACARARVSLCGGETATLPDMVKELDLSGTALGCVPKGMQIDGGSVVSGDVVVGLPSSGLHSNGFSLVRKVVEKSGVALTDPAPFKVMTDTAATAVQEQERVMGESRADGKVWRHGGDRGGGGGDDDDDNDDGGRAVSLGEVLLNPTKIYVDPVMDLLLACRRGDGPCAYEDVHGIAHITGGGLSNLLRLRKGAGFHIGHPLAVLPEFAWLQRVGGVSDYEMHRTFNMGMGMCIVVAHAAAHAVQRWLARRLPGTRVVGEANESGRVTHALDGVAFDSY